MDPRRLIAVAALRCLQANASDAKAGLKLLNDYRIGHIAGFDNLVDTECHEY